MLRHGRIVVCIAAVVLLIAATASATTYTFTTLAPAPTGTDGIPYAFSAVSGGFEIGGTTKGGFTPSRGTSATWFVPASVAAAGNGTVAGVINPTVSQVSVLRKTTRSSAWTATETWPGIPGTPAAFSSHGTFQRPAVRQPSCRLPVTRRTPMG